MTLVVDVISDVICPWCYIGKRRPGRAIREVDNRHEARVRWHPSRFSPTMPVVGMVRRGCRTAKLGSRERSRELDARVTASTARAAKALGLAEHLGADGGDVAEALRRWEPEQLDRGRRPRVLGRRLGDRSQFGR